MYDLFIENNLPLPKFNDTDIVGYREFKGVITKTFSCKKTVDLGNSWNDIYKKLNENHTERDWRQFAVYMNSIQGLGYGNKAMLIKIPLILRELRCQKVFDNIPGKYCCVADSRVKEAFKIITCKNFYTSNIDNVLKASEKIYADYGDLYDIPLFAYKDLM